MENEFPERPPDFIDPRTINDMGPEEFDTHVERIRAERLKGYKLYQRKEADKKAAADEKARAQLDKQHEMLGKDIAAIDKALTRMCDRYVKVQALRLQLGIDL